jgi:hypothetical protein
VNVASRRVMEKAGLKFVRIFHQPWPDYIEGEEEGDAEYALLRSEWEPPPGERSPRRVSALTAWANQPAEAARQGGPSPGTPG